MLSQQTARIRYAGNGVTVAFAVPWYFLDYTHLKVVLRAASGLETVQNYAFAWSGSGAGNPAGGTVTMGIAPANGETLAILRDVPMTQAADYVAHDAFPAETHETALDKLTMLDTQWGDRWERSLKLKDTDGLAAGQFQGGGNRISDVLDPILDTDVATRLWVLSAIAAPVSVTPQKDTAQWNADRLQGRAVGNIAPTNNYVLTWSTVNNRWEPKASVDGASLLASNNTWAGSNTFNALVEAFQINMGFGAQLNFNSTLGLILGRFYGTPHANRTLLRPNVSPSDCVVGSAPYGAGTSGAYAAYGASDPDNAPVLYLAAGPTSTQIETNKIGAGVVQPLNFYTAATLAMRIQTTGRIGINTSTDNGAQVNVNGTLTRQAGAFRAHRNGVAQSIAGSVDTKINCTTEDFDQAGWYDAPNARYTPLIAGKYGFSISVQMEAAAIVDQKRLASVLYKNGAAYRLGTNIMGAGTGLEPMSAPGFCVGDANGSTDYFEMYAFQSMANPANISGHAQSTMFEGFHIG